MKLGKIYGGTLAAGGILSSFLGPYLPVQESFSPIFLALGGFTVYYLADIAEKLGNLEEDDME